jgi:hypothetical protein
VGLSIFRLSGQNLDRFPPRLPRFVTARLEKGQPIGTMALQIREILLKESTAAAAKYCL